ncbi:hypothetical protein STCU_11937 [Strigomonas culicis]|uniref:Uncharacterized protein n=1 Tax=Strigomonas culicis TaxID=28005 RepID=S9ULI8_9TRYP|nr:hypothetical protein STCU_11937 [Strigomonas culicis]|eukprot:EPY15546.1 hypothetical protein STCU_11937 [Strigomonas culicis]
MKRSTFACRSCRAAASASGGGAVTTPWPPWRSCSCSAAAACTSASWRRRSCTCAGASHATWATGATGTCRSRAANFSVVSASASAPAPSRTCATALSSPFPPTLPRSSIVSRLARNGTWPPPRPSASTTCSSALSERFVARARAWAAGSPPAARHGPARSTRHSRAWRRSGSSAAAPRRSTHSRTTRWAKAPGTGRSPVNSASSASSSFAQGRRVTWRSCGSPSASKAMEGLGPPARGASRSTITSPVSDRKLRCTVYSASAAAAAMRAYSADSTRCAIPRVAYSPPPKSV